MRVWSVKVHFVLLNTIDIKKPSLFVAVGCCDYKNCTHYTEPDEKVYGKMESKTDLVCYPSAGTSSSEKSRM